MTFLVHVKYPNGTNQSFQFEKESIYLGRRDGNDIKLAFPFVSGRHLMIRYHEGMFFVEDLGSTNGTLINGQSLEPNVPQPVRPGDVVQIGSLEIHLEPIQDATIIESVPDLDTRPEGVPKAQNPPPRTAVESAAGPSAMWQLQTGMFSFDKGSLQGLTGEPAPQTAGPQVPAAPHDFERSLILRKTRMPDKSKSKDELDIPWPLIFQIFGLLVTVATLALLIVILLV